MKMPLIGTACFAVTEEDLEEITDHAEPRAEEHRPITLRHEAFLDKGIILYDRACTIEKDGAARRLIHDARLFLRGEKIAV